MSDGAVERDGSLLGWKDTLGASLGIVDGDRLGRLDSDGSEDGLEDGCAEVLGALDRDGVVLGIPETEGIGLGCVEGAVLVLGFADVEGALEMLGELLGASVGGRTGSDILVNS